ncbi:S8 family serine peptidase [Deinococcus sp.]|uniref:S8 family serine peptidase n=1 Tax=Deinococcus sp. TaxID=47478 RepID=UPI003B5B4045
MIKRPLLQRSILLLGAALSLAGLSQASAGRLSPSLLTKARAGDNTPIGVIVRFQVANTPQGRDLFKNLRGQLQTSLNKLGPAAGFVNAAINKNGVQLWLDQSIFVQLSPVQARVLATLPIVDEIFENFKVQLPKAYALSAASAPSGTPYQLEAIGAKQAQAAGFKGQGVRIGHLDTGIDPNSPEYKGKILNYAEFNGDGDKIQSSPHDSAQHGTHTAGLLVGNTVGVAPDAKLISALVLPDGSGTFAQVIAGMQWVLDPDNNADTNDGANVVSMSLGLPGTYQEFVQPVKNMLKAGVVPVFAIGNFGPSAGSTGSPGNIPDVIGVGAVDQNGQVASFSSRGPVAWTGEYNGTFTKPDIAAPGVAITSSFPGGGYGSLSGSSQAAPIAAGAVAVMLGAKPGTSVDAIKNALYQSASNNGQKNNNTGYGQINLPGALSKLGVNVTAAPAPQPAPKPAPAPTPAPQPAPAPKPQPAPPKDSGNSGNVPTPNASNTVPPVGGYVFCAPEGGTCDFKGERQAAFGANGRYVAGTATDGFKCTVAEWGSDPVPTVRKACFIKPAEGGSGQAPAPQPAPKPSQPAPAPQPAPSASKKPSVLLVDDDGGQSAGVTGALRDAVKASAAPGGAFGWSVASQGAVPLSEMQKYDIVLWLTGDQYDNTLTAADQQNLQNYLSGGGRLIVSGQDVGYDIGDTDFYRNTLKTQFVADSSGTTKVATTGPLGGNTYILNADGSAKNQLYPDVIADIGNSAVDGYWGNVGAKAGSIQAQSVRSDSNKRRAQDKAAKPRGLIEQVTGNTLRQFIAQAAGGKAVKQPKVRAQSAGQDAGAIVFNDAGRYRTINMGFGLEGLNPSSRAAMIKASFDWLMR